MRKVVIFLILCFGVSMQAQNTDRVKKRGPADSYSRSSMSYLLLDFPDERFSNYLHSAMESLRVPQKFDENDIPRKSINAPYQHGESGSQSYGKSKKIIEALKNHNYANEIMRYWWQVKDDGSYSLDLIQKRGLYNATDMDASLVDASKVGRARLADAGLSLIDKSYVLVLDYEGLITMKEIYDRQDAIARKQAKEAGTTFTPVERKRNGFRGELTAYLYKLNYSDTIQGYLDASFIDEKNFDINKFEKIFDHIHTPYRRVIVQQVKADGTQLNPGQKLAPLRQKNPQELFEKLVHSSVKKVINNIEKRVEAFRVKTSVASINPIKAKIGTKEGVKCERRFYVWEYVANRKEKVVAKKVATIRAWHVANNVNDELGHTQTTDFYQIGGRKIEEGMTLQERKDLGFGVGMGVGNLGFHIQADINTGQYLDLPFKQLKLYGELVIGSKEYDNVVVVSGSTMKPKDTYNQFVWAVGILKEYPFMRGNLRAGWKFGVSGISMTWEQDKNHVNYDLVDQGEGISAIGLAWGANFGVNLFSPSLQLIGSVGGFHHFNPSYNSGDKGEELVKLDNSLSEIFPDKSSISFSLSMRLSF